MKGILAYAKTHQLKSNFHFHIYLVAKRFNLLLSRGPSYQRRILQHFLQHFTTGEVALVSAKKTITEFPETSKCSSCSSACGLHYSSLAAFCCCWVSLFVPFLLPHCYLSHRSFHSIVKQTSPKSHHLSAVSPRFRG